ncbi:MAG: Uma2 family endonuclease [Polyangiaceae bacterium]|nr:Uma2 family endonuclease [Polyangiaceae bacterium]
MTTQATSSLPVKSRRAKTAEVEVLDRDERFVIYGVSWPAYVAIRNALDDHAGLHLTYLEGTLELMSPSNAHEEYKTIIARLVEAYAEEMDLDLNGFGSMTVRKRAKKRGLEPDECYSLGQPGKVPDIAIEVVLTSGVVNKMTVYEGLGVPEVWVWEAGAFKILRLTERGYEPRRRSEVLPDLDFQFLASFVETGGSQTPRIKAFRRAIRARRSGRT